MSLEFDKPWLEYTHYVYELYDKGGYCLYVGCTFRIGPRLQQHATKPWWDSVTRIEVNAYENEATAIRAEKDRIQFLNPVHNKVFTDHPAAHGWALRRANAEKRHQRGEMCQPKHDCLRCNAIRRQEVSA
jgi:hypothetical protein